MSRLERTELLLGREAVTRLKCAHVVVAGMGAVGSFAVEALARSGVGHLRLVDFDTVHTSNLNRQLYALESTLGRSKVELAAGRVRDINPECAVEVLEVFISRETVPRVLAPPVDCVIDAIDSLGPKIDLLVACVEAGIPVVSSMGAARKTNPLAIRVAGVFESHTCPLARFVRSRLRARGVAGGVRCVFSTEPSAEHSLGDSGDRTGEWVSPEQNQSIRRPLGSLVCVTGTVGLVAAREAIAMLTGLSSVE